MTSLQEKYNRRLEEKLKTIKKTKKKRNFTIIGSKDIPKEKKFDDIYRSHKKEVQADCIRKKYYAGKQK